MTGVGRSSQGSSARSWHKRWEHLRHGRGTGQGTCTRLAGCERWWCRRLEPTAAAAGSDASPTTTAACAACCARSAASSARPTCRCGCRSHSSGSTAASRSMPLRYTSLLSATTVMVPSPLPPPLLPSLQLLLLPASPLSLAEPPPGWRSPCRPPRRRACCSCCWRGSGSNNDASTAAPTGSSAVTAWRQFFCQFDPTRGHSSKTQQQAVACLM